jgi:uncharacterized protein YjiK
VFQTNLDFAAGTASNGSATTTNSTNLFNPALTGLLDFADVFAMSNLADISAAEQDHLLLLSQESGKIIEVDRAGNLHSSLTLPLMPNAGGLSLPDQQPEGMTMDKNGVLYIVAENGGGDINHPELWVYTSSTMPAVPEPESYALALIGMGLLGSAARRASKKN